MHVTLRVLPDKERIYSVNKQVCGQWMPPSLVSCPTRHTPFSEVSWVRTLSWQQAQWSGLSSRFVLSSPLLGDWANAAIFSPLSATFGFLPGPRSTCSLKAHRDVEFSPREWATFLVNEVRIERCSGCSTWTRGGSQGVMSSFHGSSSLPGVLYPLPHLNNISKYLLRVLSTKALSVGALWVFTASRPHTMQMGKSRHRGIQLLAWSTQ